jgi:hypothetical protein
LLTLVEAYRNAFFQQTPLLLLQVKESVRDENSTSKRDSVGRPELPLKRIASFRHYQSDHEQCE